MFFTGVCVPFLETFVGVERVSDRGASCALDRFTVGRPDVNEYLTHSFLLLTLYVSWLQTPIAAAAALGRVFVFYVVSWMLPLPLVCSLVSCPRRSFFSVQSVVAAVHLSCPFSRLLLLHLVLVLVYTGAGVGAGADGAGAIVVAGATGALATTLATTTDAAGTGAVAVMVAAGVVAVAVAGAADAAGGLATAACAGGGAACAVGACVCTCAIGTGTMLVLLVLVLCWCWCCR